MLVPFCSECSSGVKKYTGPSCRICATHITSEDTNNLCRCMKKPPLFSKAMSVVLYEDTPAATINFFKFQHIRGLYNHLAICLSVLICPAWTL